MTTTTYKKLAQDVLFAQNGCNIVALANGFARAMKSMREVGMSDNDIIQSPITTLWISKFSSLNGWRSEWPTALSRAFDFVESMAKEDKCS